MHRLTDSLGPFPIPICSRTAFHDPRSMVTIFQQIQHENNHMKDWVKGNIVDTAGQLLTHATSDRVVALSSSLLALHSGAIPTHRCLSSRVAWYYRKDGYASWTASGPKQAGKEKNVILANAQVVAKPILSLFTSLVSLLPVGSTGQLSLTQKSQCLIVKGANRFFISYDTRLITPSTYISPTNRSTLWNLL